MRPILLTFFLIRHLSFPIIFRRTVTSRNWPILQNACSKNVRVRNVPSAAQQQPLKFFPVVFYACGTQRLASSSAFLFSGDFFRGADDGRDGERASKRKQNSSPKKREICFSEKAMNFAPSQEREFYFPIKSVEMSNLVFPKKQNSDFPKISKIYWRN